MIETDNYYWYGLSAMAYIVTCWVFSVVRGIHNCGTPKERRDYIWPDRKMQVVIYLCATILLPYVLNPRSEAAWLLMKTYFPCTYYFYCGAMMFCFFGTVRQWKNWKTANFVAGVITALAMMPFALHAWLPSGLLTPESIRICNIIVIVVSVLMMVYAGIAMWQVWTWMKIACDVNFSNPEDFPTEYAHRVWLAPIILTPLLWPAFIFDSPTVMAILCVPLAVFNIVLLLTVMPVWRRTAILSDIGDEEAYDDLEANDELAEERTNRIAADIEQFVNTEAAYLDSHLKLEQVVERCSFSRSYVSKVFTERFGGFSNYVNGLRVDYYDRYVAQHPNATEESAAEASGFTSHKAYVNAKERLPRK
jgi:AraC-like DNA-binding protein